MSLISFEFKEQYQDVIVPQLNETYSSAKGCEVTDPNDPYSLYPKLLAKMKSYKLDILEPNQLIRKRMVPRDINKRKDAKEQL